MQDEEHQFRLAKLFVCVICIMIRLLIKVKLRTVDERGFDQVVQISLWIIAKCLQNRLQFTALCLSCLGKHYIV